MTLKNLDWRHKSVLFLVLAFATKFAFCGTSQNFDVYNSSDHPKGWSVNYVESSCIVKTKAKDDASKIWTVSMGYLYGDETVFVYMISNEMLQGKQLTDIVGSWFVVNNRSEFPAIGTKIVGDQMITVVKNSAQLKRAISSGKILGVGVQRANSGSKTLMMPFALSNLSGAMKWLSVCAQKMH